VLYNVVQVDECEIRVKPVSAVCKCCTVLCKFVQTYRDVLFYRKPARCRDDYCDVATCFTVVLALSYICLFYHTAHVRAHNAGFRYNIASPANTLPKMPRGTDCLAASWVKKVGARSSNFSTVSCKFPTE